MPSQLFDVHKQLTFYGAYHANPINILVHVIFVPVLFCTGQVILSTVLPTPSFIPALKYEIAPYLVFDTSSTSIITFIFLAYYYALEPTAALLYTPQFVFSLLLGLGYAQTASSPVLKAGALHAFSWVVQIIAHVFAEGRAPAFLDNILGAFVLAPFFVHLEILFFLGYKPEMHKRLQNDVGKEIARIRRAEGDKKRAAAAASSKKQ